MNESINQINKLLESIVEKLRKNSERLEKKVIDASKELDEENAAHGEYEALALIKKEAIISKALYQYYSQKLNQVIEKAETSIADSITLNSQNNAFQVEMESRDIINSVNLEDLFKGVESQAVASELLSSFAPFARSTSAPSEDSNESILYENDEKQKYDIKATDDENVLMGVCSNAATIDEDLMTNGFSYAATIDKDLIENGKSYAATIDEDLIEHGKSNTPTVKAESTK